MVISNTGKNKIRDLVANSIDSGKVGTDGTSATVGDTDLGAEVVGVDKAPTISVSNKTINLQYEVFSTEAVGDTLKEGAVYFDDDVLLDRYVFPDFISTTSNSLVMIDVIKVL